MSAPGSRIIRRRLDEFEYAEQFDLAMKEQFGEEFETTYNIFAGPMGSYTTRRTNGRKMTKAMALFGRGWSNGTQAVMHHMRTTASGEYL